MDSVRQYFSVEFGVLIIALMNFVALFRVWPFIMERLNERRRDIASEKAKDWSRRTEEIERLHKRLDECETVRIEWMRRAITAEATLQGYGDAVQQAQTILSAERIAIIKPKEKPGG